MSQPTTEPPHPPQQETAADARPFRVSGTGGWRYAVREFVIIVAGVLVALGAQAVWEYRQDRERERSYLSQLLSETRENEALLLEAIAIDSAGRDGARQVMDVLTTSGPADIPAFFEAFGAAGEASDFKAVSGSFQALLRSGEMRVIRDDSLRIMITRYAASLEAETLRMSQLRGAILDAVSDLGRELPFMRRVFFGGPDMSRFDLAALRADDEAVAVIFTLHAANENRLNNLRPLLAETVRMREALERATQ